MKYVFLVAALSTSAFARNPGCAQIDPGKTFPDKIPYCPEVVSEATAFAVTRCAYNQAKSWHAATKTESAHMLDLVQGLKDADSAKILDRANKLNLQVCRSQKAGDSFLLMYTKPGVKNYSGPFIMYREGGNDSGLVLQSPHDGQDGTHASTKAAFQLSNALALFSNGHPRRISGPKGVTKRGPYPSDWAHTRSDLGWTTFLAFKQKFPNSIHLHIHGLAAKRVMVTDSVGWKGPKHLLRSAFINSSQKALTGRNYPVVEWRFNGWETGLAMTQKEGGKGREANERWLGMEVAVKIHQNTNLLAKMIRQFEEDYLHKTRPVEQDVLDAERPSDPDDVVDEDGMQEDL